MATVRDKSQHPAVASLEAIATSARSGFACMFSTSDEYEAALIDQRRAEGRYKQPSRLPAVAFVCCSLAIAAVVLIAS